MLRRRPEGRIPPPQPINEDFQPLTEWVQDPFNYILLVHLPGFTREDLRVITDKSGKITVRGRRQVGDTRFAAFEQSYDVPKDSKLDMIRGKFEDSCLALTIPKITTVETEKAVVPSEDKKEEPISKGIAKMAEEKRKEEVAVKEKKEEPISKEKPKMAEVQRKEGAELKEKKDELTLKEKPKLADNQMKEESVLKDMKEEPISKEKPNMHEEQKKEEAAQKEMMDELTSKKKEIKEEPTLKEKSKMEEDKKEAVHKEIAESVDENKKEEPTKKKPSSSSSMDEKKGEAIREDKLEGCEEKKDEFKKLRRCNEGVEEKPKEKESRKRRWFWNVEDKGWLDWLDIGLFDDVLEKVNRNRKVIAVAFVAFSTGFYISHKLRTRGR